MVRKLFLR